MTDFNVSVPEMVEAHTPRGAIPIRPVAQVTQVKTVSTTPTKKTLGEILGSEKELQNLVNRVKTRLKKERQKVADFSSLQDKAVWVGQFPAPGPMSIESHVIDPEVAEVILLEYNDLNRLFNLKKAVEWAYRIISGQWRMTHQGIAFTADKNCQDGQHRALGLCLAGKINPKARIEMFIAFNSPKENRDIIDNTLTRNSGDVLVMDGKLDGLVFTQKGYKNVKISDIIALVNAMPSRKAFSKDAKVSFGLENLDKITSLLSKCLDINALPYAAGWAGAFVDAALLFDNGKTEEGKPRSKPIEDMLTRFVANQWNQHEGKRLDPLHNLFIKLNNNRSVARSTRLTRASISDSVVFAIRKSLLKETVVPGNSPRSEARFSSFNKEEVEDYAFHKEKSKILKSRSISAVKKKKKIVEMV